MEEFNNIMENYYHGSPYDFDRFDMSKIGSGDGKAKFGWGIYFSDDIGTAQHYAADLSIGNNKTNGFNLYHVNLRDIDNFLVWENAVPDYILQKVIIILNKKGLQDEASQLQKELEEYGGWDGKSLYEWLSYVVGSQQNASLLLKSTGVPGMKVTDQYWDGSLYVVYSDDIIRILDKEKI